MYGTSGAHGEGFRHNIKPLFHVTFIQYLFFTTSNRNYYNIMKSQLQHTRGACRIKLLAKSAVRSIKIPCMLHFVCNMRLIFNPHQTAGAHHYHFFFFSFAYTVPAERSIWLYYRCANLVHYWPTGFRLLPAGRPTVCKSSTGLSSWPGLAH